MLSLIISSASNDAFTAFQKNVPGTIGDIAYEIIRIENNKGEVGICEAYNIGALKAQYDCLCFIHEDVQFTSQQWGSKLIAHIQSDNIGIVGVAGSIYKGRMVSAWWQQFHTNIQLRRVNITQHFKHTESINEKQLNNPVNEVVSEVISLDGVLLAMKKQTWVQYPFDQNLLKGFHGYDLDISLAIGQTLKNIVVFDIDLEHFSEGLADMSWFYNLLNVHYKFRKTLPRMQLVHNQRLHPCRADWDTVNLYVEKMIADNLPFIQLILNTYKLISLVDHKTGTGISFIKGFFNTIITLLWRLLKRKRTQSITQS